ncbi:Uncharacterized protein L728 [Camellia lanceoleosa]|uniref:Uncharacterized protein L728 n=1 Tax=Camellia lanceoleosa TaxID=1840588 RepID=A0ACC0IH12_9ERIC|nr:Uncharacterized protein L728 [Camellia lanceoleosa]
MKSMAASPSSLLGPPEIHRQTTTTTTTTRRAATDPFMDLMVANFNSRDLTSDPPMGYTENFSLTFLSTGNPCLDFFFHVVPDTPASTLTHRLQSAWDHDPLITLKLVCNLRGVRGTGKSNKEGYYTAALWLHNHYPKTLACNVASLSDFGCFKDLPEILYRLLEGPNVRRIAKQEWKSRKSGNRRVPVRPGVFGGGVKAKKVERSPREARVLAEMKRAEIEKEMASNSREDKKIAAAKKALERYSRDPDYRFLFDRVSDLFAECLKSDINSLNSGESNKISLAAKWCPSLDSSFDRSTLLCESIARRVFPRESYPEEYEGIEDAHYAYRVRDRLRKQVLVPLRKALELPEVYIGANQWNSIPYDRVASLAMKLYKDKFLKHDKERFEEYLERVKSGKATIAAGALLRHKIIGALNEGDGGQVAELQWKRMVDDMSKKEAKELPGSL